MSKLKINLKINNVHTTKLVILLVLHILGAFFLTFFFMLALSYLGYIGELSSKGLLFLWQKIGSNVLPIGILMLSVLVIILSNPIYALICLILIFFSTALLLVSLNVNFLGMIYLIIYIGAIAILFLFVLMIFNLRDLNQQSDSSNNYSSVFIALGLYFFAVWQFYTLISSYILTYIQYDKYFNDFANKKFESLQYFLTYQHTDTLLFGTLLYEYYSYLFILAALVLLTSMVGSITLALSTTEKTINYK